MSGYVFLLLLSGLLFLVFKFLPRRGLPLPPGPKTYPIVGNIPQLPTKFPWKQFHEWTKQYGPIFRLLAGRDTIIVLGSYETAHELLDKRSTNFSSRPYMPMAGELLCHGMHTLLRPWDAQCKLHKRMAAPLLSTAASRRYIPLQELESLHMLRELHNSNDFVPALHRYAASVMFSLVYGFRIETLNDPAMLAAHEIQKNFTTSMKQGYWAVDAIPALRHLPEWMAPFKQKARRWYEFESRRHLENLHQARNRPAWNWTKELLASKEANEVPELEIAYDAGILVDAGLDTTGQTLEMFVMIAINHPEKVALAQTELDRIVGRDRLPTFNDSSSLPYVSAFIEEVLRWRPLVVAGVPHSNLHEDTYMGYRIPKGSVVIATSWSIHMDPSIYGDPEAFRPERWLEKGDEPLPNVSFGYGRRICAGMTIARQSVFTVISRLLWSFDIQAPLDQFGKRVQVDPMALTDFFVIKPEPFQATFTPRHNRTLKVLSKGLENSEADLGKLLDSIHASDVTKDG
ncbi:putative cytochrome P450 [Thozetella sp. PMI_491]|nr:putative cytochrome P450 [Thozetella sp. PMI_491]